jgi:hypothetical protein
VSAAALLSTSAPKLSFPCDGSDLTGLCGALWKDTFVGASDVTLTTARPLAMKLDLRSARTGPFPAL